MFEPAAEPPFVNPATPPALEAATLGWAMQRRLALAAGRLGGEPGSRPVAGHALRAEQARVFSAFAEYLLTAVTGPELSGPPFCRIVLPPRTGKTVIAGHIIARTALTATVVTPTRTLVRQTVRLLQQMLPGVPVGAFNMDDKAVVDHGVNVTSYAMLVRCGDRLPAPLRSSALVFVDEAHRAMTAARMKALCEAFDPAAVRVALTATPDYDAERRLSRFFPDLVHEISLGEALDLGLLAPVRVWVAEVDAARSAVRMVGGDYEQQTLGRLMSAAPYFKAATSFRYSGPSASKAALVCCSTRQQAYDLVRFLDSHRPPGTPAPALLLGETPGAEREEALRSFERGDLDTLVQVGVLIEGWSSPRCKLLIDLAPSVSRVRAMQKYFRAMTRDGDAEAHLYVLLPSNLPELPILPTDLFGSPVEEYECGALLSSTQPSAVGRKPIEVHSRTPVAGVRLRQRVLLQASLRKPTLGRDDYRALRGVLATCPDFDAEKPCGRYRFRSLLFQHPRFTGRGEFLLEWLRFPPSEAGYQDFLALACPEALATRLLAERGLGEHEVLAHGCERDVEILERALACRSRGPRWSAASDAWLALGGHRQAAARSPEDRALELEAAARLAGGMKRLKPRELSVVERRFGLSGEEPLTLDGVGIQDEISRERVREIEARGLRRMRRFFAHVRPPEEAFLEDGRPLRPGFAREAWVYGAADPPPAWYEAEAAEHVLRVLVEAGRPMAPTEIAEALDSLIVDVAAGRLLLWRSGLIRRTPHGYVALTASAGQGGPRPEKSLPPKSSRRRTRARR